MLDLFKAFVRKDLETNFFPKLEEMVFSPAPIQWFNHLTQKKQMEVLEFMPNTLENMNGEYQYYGEAWNDQH